LEYSSPLKTHKLLKKRDAQYLQHQELPHWNLSGTRGPRRRSQFLVREKWIRERFLFGEVVRDNFRRAD